MFGAFAVSLTVESVLDAEEFDVLSLQLVRIAIAIITKENLGFMVENFAERLLTKTLP